ncbi:MAG: cytochrome P450 [Enhygromyxa sp.]
MPTTAHAPSPLPTPPGARGLPLLGETLEFIRSPNRFANARRDQYGPVFATHLFGKPTVFMYGAEANRWIYAGEGKYLENEWLPAIRKLLGATSLSLISGEEHKQRRKLLAPYFKRTSMGECIPGMLAVTQKHLRRWRTDAELGPLTIVPRMRSLAFEIAAVYVLGEVGDLGVGLDEFSREFNTWTAGMFAPVPVAIPGGKFARAMAARQRMFTLLDDLVMRRDASSRRGPDVLSALLEVRDEDGEVLPRDTIVDELQLLLFAGHDTTVTATTNAVYHLALHPEVAARARAEQDALGPQDRRFTLEQIRSMTYLEAVITESMRVIPPIGGSFRVMIEDAEFGGFRIPRGWRVAIGPRSVHFDPELYPDPERFDPQRWLAGERPPFTYIPFGGGPRTCLGMHFALLQMHIVLALLLREFVWELAADQDLSFTELPLPLPRSGLIVNLERRPA